MKNGKAKIGGFGFSRTVEGEQMLMSTVGTKNYSAPQII